MKRWRIDIYDCGKSSKSKPRDAYDDGPYKVRLVIGNQGFTIDTGNGEGTSLKRACWFKKQLNKAMMTLFKNQL